MNWFFNKRNRTSSVKLTMSQLDERCLPTIIVGPTIVSPIVVQAIHYGDIQQPQDPQDVGRAGATGAGELAVANNIGD